MKTSKETTVESLRNIQRAIRTRNACVIENNVIIDPEFMEALRVIIAQRLADLSIEVNA